MKRTLVLTLSGILLVAAHPLAQSTHHSVPMPPTDVKTAFLKMLDRPQVPLDIKTHETKPAHRGVVSERLDFAVEAHPDGTTERVPALVVRPEGMTGRLPAVLVLHGTGGRKEGSWQWLEQLAHRGFVAIAIDGRYHGDRAEGKKGTKAYNEAIARAWRAKPGEPQAHPFYYDTCWDIWRTIDYLQTRLDVDPNRIGVIGTSKGGIETWLAAAVDDRVKVAVPAIAVQSFRWGLDHDHWQARANTIKEAHEVVAADLGQPTVDRATAQTLWAKVIPGITDQFDGPSMVRLFAGRSLLILNGEKDPNCPIEGAELAFAAARAAFHDAEADDHLKIMVAKGVAHAISPSSTTRPWSGSSPGSSRRCRPRPRGTSIGPASSPTSSARPGAPPRSRRPAPAPEARPTPLRPPPGRPGRRPARRPGDDPDGRLGPDPLIGLSPRPRPGVDRPARFDDARRGMVGFGHRPLGIGGFAMMTRLVGVALTLAFLVLPGPADAETRTIARHGPGFLEEVDGTKVLHLKGSPREIGLQHGTLLKDDIRASVRFLFDVKAKEFSPKAFGVKLPLDPKRMILSIAATQRKFVPDRYYEELRGIAEGSGLPVEEIIAANFIPEMFHCSGFALGGSATKDGTLYHGRVLDYGCDWKLQEHAVLVVAEPDGAIPFVNVTYAGFIGSVTGMNARKISIGEMGGGGQGHWEGVPMALLVRMALEGADDLDEAVAVFRDHPRTCQYFYVVADGNSGRAVGMEASWNAFTVIRMGETEPRLPHAFADSVLLSIGSRYEELSRRVEEGHGTFDAESARRLMDRPVAMKSNLHNVLFETTTGRFWVANASPEGEPAATQPYHGFRLPELLGHKPDPSAPDLAQGSKVGG